MPERILVKDHNTRGWYATNNVVKLHIRQNLPRAVGGSAFLIYSALLEIANEQRYNEYLSASLSEICSRAWRGPTAVKATLKLLQAEGSEKHEGLGLIIQHSQKNKETGSHEANEYELLSVAPLSHSAAKGGAPQRPTSIIQESDSIFKESNNKTGNDSTKGNVNQQLEFTQTLTPFRLQELLCKYYYVWDTRCPAYAATSTEKREFARARWESRNNNTWAPQPDFDVEAYLRGDYVNEIGNV